MGFMEKMSKKDNNLVECRNCKAKLKKSIRRCPYCGILNPTVTVKEVLTTTIIIVVILFILNITIINN